MADLLNRPNNRRSFNDSNQTTRGRPPSLAVACPGRVEPRWLATLPSCAVNTHAAACAWLLHDAVVPRGFYRLKHRETQSRFRFNDSSRRKAEIAIAFAHDSLLKSTLDDAQGVGGFRSHLEKCGRTCHCVPGAGGVFRLFEHPKVKALRTNAANAQAARDAAERRQANANLNAPPGETAGAGQQGGK